MNSEEIQKRIKKQNKVIAVAGIAIVAGIFILIGFSEKGIRSSSELEEIKQFLFRDVQINKTYGKVIAADLDSYEYSSSLINGSKSGCFLFSVRGEYRSGIHRICWEKKESAALRVLSQDTVKMSSWDDIKEDLKTLFRGNPK